MTGYIHALVRARGVSLCACVCACVYVFLCIIVLNFANVFEDSTEVLFFYCC